MTWDEIKELGPLYALGAVDEDTARSIEEFLHEATPEQQHEITELREVAALLPLALPQPNVPESLRDRLFFRISGEGATTPEIADDTRSEVSTQTDGSAEPYLETARILPFTQAPRRESSGTKWLLLAATVLLTFTSGYLLWRNYQLHTENSQLAQENNRARTEVRQIVSPETKIISMNGLEAPQASAKLVWDTNRQTWAIYIFNLPPPPTDKQYQLWYVKANAKISAMVFDTDPAGEKVLKLELPAEVMNGLAATAVTLEPRGGSKQPTSNLYLLGKI